MSTLLRPSAHARVAALLALLCASLSVAGREYTDRQFTTYTDWGSYGGFEGMSITVMRGGDRTLLVKPFKPMQVCTDDGGDCFIQPPIFLYEYDAVEGGFVDVSALITNPEEFLIPFNFTYEAGDFNGDGRDDLVFTTNGEYFAPRGEYGRGWRWENFILLSNDDGTFTWQQLHEFKGVTFHGGPSIGDIDGDGDLDLFIDDAADPDDWSNYKELAIEGILLWPDYTGGYFLFNDGKGNFTRSERRFAQPSMSELADFDGDGDLDLALKIVDRSCFPELPPSSCRIFNGIYLYENNGNGDFTEVAGDIPFTTEHSFDRDDDWNIKFYGEVMENRSMRSLVALDANNDGLPDLAVSVEDNDGERVNLTSILINQGGFEFSLELDRFPHVTRHQVSNRLRAIDADQDGFTDLYFENKQVSGIDISNPLSESIYFNDGKGFFSNDNRLGLPDDDGILTVADVNSDRVYDFISSWGFQQNYESEVMVSRTTTVMFSDPESIEPRDMAITVEEPVLGEIHTGVGNLRGWAVADTGVDKIEIWIDDVYAFDVPYGGARGDVGAAFPDIAESANSGFSMAYSYSSLTPGTHTLKAIGYDSLIGLTTERETEFSVVKFDEDFISDPNAVNLDSASCSLAGDEIVLTDARVSEDMVDMTMKWRRAEQGFEIIEIRQSGMPVAMNSPRLAANAPAATSEEKVFRVVLEEPVDGEIHSGVGNLRGWAVASDGIEKIEIYIDGGFALEAPYGGERSDVGAVFPDVPNSSDSGFSLAFTYSNLSAGSHVIEAVAYTTGGVTERSSSAFEVVKFSENFISDPNAVNLDNAECITSGDELTISNALVAGQTYQLKLDWRRAEQGFEIIEIR